MRALMILLLLSAPALAQDVTGPARVIDGDTIAIGTTRIRLWGIDAPEMRDTCRLDGRAWPCGPLAARVLEAIIAGDAVTCARRDVDHYGRIVGACRVGVTDLSAWLVRQGFAVAYRRYSLDYVGLQDEARDHHRGLFCEGCSPTPAMIRRGYSSLDTPRGAATRE